MKQLLAKILRSAVTRPTGCWGAVVEDLYAILRRTIVHRRRAVRIPHLECRCFAVQLFDIVGAAQLFGSCCSSSRHGPSPCRSTRWSSPTSFGAAPTATVGVRKLRGEVRAMDCRRLRMNRGATGEQAPSTSCRRFRRTPRPICRWREPRRLDRVCGLDQIPFEWR